MTDNVARLKETEKRAAEFCRLHDQGLSYTQIAIKCGTTRGTVSGAIWRRTKPEAERRYRKTGHTNAPKPRLTAGRERMLQAFRPEKERDFVILGLLASGYSFYAVGHRLGISHRAVMDVVWRRCGGREAYRNLMVTA
jgi:hypothetical protein